MRQYAELSGDVNPVHLAETGGIVHGTLLLGLVSGLVASRLPGPGTKLTGIQARFLEPCPVDAGVVVTVSLGRVRKLTQAHFSIVNFWSGEKLVEGEATLYLTADMLRK